VSYFSCVRAQLPCTKNRIINIYFEHKVVPKPLHYSNNQLIRGERIMLGRSSSVLQKKIKPSSCILLALLKKQQPVLYAMHTQRRFFLKETFAATKGETWEDWNIDGKKNKNQMGADFSYLAVDQRGSNKLDTDVRKSGYSSYENPKKDLFQREQFERVCAPGVGNLSAVAEPIEKAESVERERAFTEPKAKGTICDNYQSTSTAPSQDIRRERPDLNDISGRSSMEKSDATETYFKKQGSSRYAENAETKGNIDFDSSARSNKNLNEEKIRNNLERRGV
jgi:hypothetical protein